MTRACRLVKQIKARRLLKRGWKRCTSSVFRIEQSLSWLISCPRTMTLGTKCLWFPSYSLRMIKALTKSPKTLSTSSRTWNKRHHWTSRKTSTPLVTTCKVSNTLSQSKIDLNLVSSRRTYSIQTWSQSRNSTMLKTWRWIRIQRMETLHPNSTRREPSWNQLMTLPSNSRMFETRNQWIK